ncbi:AGAP010175-PA [Anopheles gambiae str. PEST]|uniref:AGAP010175-PA n=1 Tax=Anopheles gambiae TaxID=7165 RepID=Q7PJT7_ANOGA|nr:AGAP010175-PA [Anopheles gambiae str. PEST]
MFSCCRCVNPKSPKQKEKSAKLSDSEEEEEREQQSKKQNETNASAYTPREPRTVNDVIEESNLSNPVDSDEKATEENNAADSVPAGTAGSASSSPASKTLSNTDRGQTDQSGPSSGVVTEIEAKLPTNESTDADSTGDATNTPQEIPTTVSFRESCLSRRSSSKSSIKKKVAYNDSTEVIPPPEYPPPEDDDSVFSDSVPPKLPRGDMCTPYATKRGSLPGMIALPDWFAEDRLMMLGGIMEPPTTPIGRDELALRRHRFFSELLNAAHAAVEHLFLCTSLRADCDPDLKPSSARELECLIDRLERIVDRLERTHNTTTVIQSKPSALLNHTNPLTIQEQGTAVLSLSSSQHGTLGGTTSKMSINAYEDIMLGSFANFIALSNKIGGDVATQAQFVKEAFDAQFAFLKVASASSAPSNTDLQNLLKPTSDKISTIQSYREKNRTSPFFNHLSAISESIPALGWVCVAPTPGPYVKEMNDAGQFYTNRVLKDWKEKDSTHVEWARAWIQTLTELQQYIKQHHTTGLVWSGKDKPTVGGASVPPPPPPGGLPPPPPMMPLGDLSADGSGDDRSALFAQINQGADITKGLKKVTADMQTHKNPSLRSGPAPYKAPAGVTNGTKSVAPPAAAAVAKPPTFTRDGKKWLIEYQKNNPDLVVENAEMNNVVYMFRCEGSTLQIKGKINSVVMDSCKKCSLVFDSLVASAEFVNCQSVQMQVLGKVPTISIDKTDGCQMYLSADSLAVEIVSSKSSEMNVMIPKGSSGDYTEQPIPEQFKTIVKGSSLNTTCVESLG